jgi:pyruvate/2-oxoglutarate dehydrogenase complex dihydrolipoamide acyltransferase (E2) component
MREIRIPSLAENVNEATVGSWLVEAGQSVNAGQGVAELLTEKAEFTLETDCAGTVSACLAPEKSVLPVGYILCVLDATEEELCAAKKENERIEKSYTESDTVALASKDASVPRPVSAAGVRATPAARRLAKENGVDLGEIAEALKISGPVKEEQVREFLQSR